MKKINRLDLEKLTGGTMSPLKCFGLGMLIIGWAPAGAVFSSSIAECWNN
ncbi:hypothetical protein [Flavobacterium sp.]|nr:hypothetical protein [Flavobacterium sp.]